MLCGSFCPHLRLQNAPALCYPIGSEYQFWWGTFLLNRISAATPRLQTFAPVDVSDAVDAEAQPLAAEGIAFFVLRGHTDADLCFQVDDKLFVGDVCMSGIGSVGYSPAVDGRQRHAYGKPEATSCNGRRVFVRRTRQTLPKNAILPSVSNKTREQKALQAV